MMKHALAASALLAALGLAACDQNQEQAQTPGARQQRETPAANQPANPEPTAPQTPPAANPAAPSGGQGDQAPPPSSQP